MFATPAEIEDPLSVVTVRDTDWSMPSVPSTTGAGQPPTIADSGSTHVKLTVTALLFQPAAFAAGAADAEIVGVGIVSRTSCGSWSEIWSMNSEFTCTMS